jgi:hypothetical protein
MIAVPEKSDPHANSVEVGKGGQRPYRNTSDDLLDERFMVESKSRFESNHTPTVHNSLEYGRRVGQIFSECEREVTGPN